MLPFKLSETSLRRQVNDKSWSRGQRYYKSGAVTNLVCRGEHIQAQVEGSNYEPYQVSLSVDAGGFKSATCTCPYDWGGWCKHIAAVGMLCCRDPHKVKLAAPVEDLLAPLDAEDLRDLVFALVAETPGLVDRVETFAQELADRDDRLDQDFEGEAQAVEVQGVGATIHRSRKPQHEGQKASVQSQVRQRQSQIDPAPYRGQAHQAIRNTVRAIENGWDDYDMELEDFPDLLAKPEDFVKAGDGANALIILDAITGTLAGEWRDLEEYGYDGEIAAQALDPLWAEALLQAELSDGDRMDWQVQLEEYAAQFAWEAFPLASEALRQGWDDLDLQAVLAGTASELWEGEAPAHADDLAQIRLKILARQDRWEEYLNFAKAEEQFRDWLVALIQRGQGEQALAELECLETVTDAKVVAEAFRAQGNLVAAVEVAQRGIELPSPREAWRRAMGSRTGSFESDSFELGPKHHELAAWAAELAEQLEDEATMLDLWMQAIAAQPKVADFNHLKSLAGEQWPALRDRLLDQLEASKTWSYNSEDIEIFLSEGRIQAAIKKLDGYHNRDMTIKVMKAAITHDPAWVIRKGTAAADDIMTRGKASHYDLAVKYLVQVKAAYLHQGQQAAWQKYRSQIQASHFRKRKLMNLMAAASLG